MTLDELYSYIVSQMTPEEALKKMLAAGLVNYDKLKFNEGEEIHPLILISYAALDLGWTIAVEKGEATSEVRGVAVGTTEYMEDLFNKKPNSNEQH